MAGIPQKQPYNHAPDHERPNTTSAFAAVAVLGAIVFFTLAAVAAMSPSATPGVNGPGFTLLSLDPDMVPLLLTAGLIIIALGLARPLGAVLTRDRY